METRWTQAPRPVVDQRRGVLRDVAASPNVRVPRSSIGHASDSDGGNVGPTLSPVIEATTLNHHQQVVIVIRDTRHVVERLTHALSEGVDRLT